MGVILVFYYGRIDKRLGPPYIFVLRKLTRLTGWSTHRTARVACIVSAGFGLTAAATAHNNILVFVWSFAVFAFLTMTWRYTIPRWQGRMEEAAQEGTIQLSMLSDLGHMFFIRTTFSFIALLDSISSIVTLQFSLSNLCEVMWGLSTAFMYFACTSYISPGRSAKDWVKDKAKSLVAALRPPVLLPAPVGA